MPGLLYAAVMSIPDHGGQPGSERRDKADEDKHQDVAQHIGGGTLENIDDGHPVDFSPRLFPLPQQEHQH